jgi:hypothetical protein
MTNATSAWSKPSNMSSICLLLKNSKLIKTQIQKIHNVMLQELTVQVCDVLSTTDYLGGGGGRPTLIMLCSSA